MTNEGGCITQNATDGVIGTMLENMIRRYDRMRPILSTMNYNSGY